MGTDDDNFFSRWSRRKVQVRQGVAPVEPVAPQPPAPGVPTAPGPGLPAAAPGPGPSALAGAEAAPPSAQTPAESADTHGPQPEPPPTLADAAQLTPSSDFRRFVAPGVDHDVKNAALKTLFTDPHFNVMDGLDTYIDDYGKPDPLPESWLKQMTQSAFLGFLTEEKPPAAESAPPEPLTATPLADPDHEDADLRLQPHPATGCEGPAPGAGPDARGEH